MDAPSPARTAIAFAVMIVTPLFFSSNLIFGRGVIGEVAPFTLAFLRWLFVAMALLPVLFAQSRAVRAMLRSHSPLLLVEGFLGMWICGAIVYVALTMTTATNGTLIYTTSPLIILIIERLFYGRTVSWREFAGILIGFSGVAIIVLRGDLLVLLAMRFNIGDLMFVGAAIAWALYSVLLRSRPSEGLDNLAFFGLSASAGALLLAPVALAEFLLGEPMPVTTQAWTGIGGIVLLSSLLAFGGFQYGISRLGAATASIFMYLMPPYGVGLAVIVLGEPFQSYHAIGIATVLTGLVMATLKSPLRKRAPVAN